MKYLLRSMLVLPAVGIWLKATSGC